MPGGVDRVPAGHLTLYRFHKKFLETHFHPGGKFQKINWDYPCSLFQKKPGMQGIFSSQTKKKTFAAFIATSMGCGPSTNEMCTYIFMTQF